ncbi:MAG: DUF951 domain-containing protein [Clostridiales bacterium]|jgi:hypothetical protein|nr:DUF951 domain-containing protein [Clostridiales bacterium]
MEIAPGMVVTSKKPHPCGSREWLLLRVGADVKLRCVVCGREVWTTRVKFEKMIKGIKE